MDAKTSRDAAARSGVSSAPDGRSGGSGSTGDDERPVPAEPPVFVVAAHRSGSTLLRLMLDHHPEIACPFEMDWALECVDPRGKLPDRARLIRHLEESGSFRRSGLRTGSERDAARLLRSIFDAATRGQRLRSATIHTRLDRIPFLWPDARYIHLVRDPRDVARSCVRQGWHGNAWAAAARWLRAEREWERLRAGLPAGRDTEVRYEDLVVRPEHELGRLCAFLGVRFDRAMLEYPRDTLFPAPDPTLASQWRRAPERDVRWVEARVGTMLESRGYVSSGWPSLQLTAAGRGLLRAQDRLGRLRSRLGRFGGSLVLMEFATRRLGLRRWHARYIDRILALQSQRVLGLAAPGPDAPGGTSEAPEVHRTGGSAP